jgi:hypothetical protein
MRKIWISLCSDRIFKTERQVWNSGEDFKEGYYCSKCKCTTTTECNCKDEKKKRSNYISGCCFASCWIRGNKIICMNCNKTVKTLAKEKELK